MMVARKEIEYSNIRKEIVEPKYSRQSNIRKVDETTYRKKYSNNEVKIEKNIKTSLKATILLGAFSLVIMCTVLLLNYAQVTSLKYQSTRQKTQIENLNEEIQRYDVELDRIKESGWIEKYALQKLNMKYPTEEQLIYLKLKNN